MYLITGIGTVGITIVIVTCMLSIVSIGNIVFTIVIIVTGMFLIFNTGTVAISIVILVTCVFFITGIIVFKYNQQN